MTKQDVLNMIDELVGGDAAFAAKGTEGAGYLRALQDLRDKLNGIEDDKEYKN